VPFLQPVACLLSITGAAQAATPCPAPQSITCTAVRYVIDSDTVVLADGRHVRLIGINAMELGHDGAPDQPYATEARDRLGALLAKSGGQVRLVTGKEQYDVHGRTLT
jgi:endonuclease YncB( thermonuclease family)